MKVAIYARVSTKDQSCELQLRDLRAYATAKNYEVITEYIEVGVSGSKTSRRQLDLLMDAARKCKFQGVLVWRFDRWARSTKHLIDTLMEFKARDIQFISYNENLDTSTPIGQAMFSIIASLSQLERDILIQRTLAGIATARAEGKQLGRPVKRPDAKILQLRNTGKSVRGIAAELGCTPSSVQRALKSKTATGL